MSLHTLEINMLSHAKKKRRDSSSKSAWETESPAPVLQPSPQDSANHAPVALTPDAIRALQSSHGNHYVQRLLAQQRESAAPVSVTQAQPDHAVQRAEGDLPTINHLPAMAQTLLEGVLEKHTIDAAVRQIYDNMFTKTGWKYNATTANAVGRTYIEGGQTVGMCESYRNAFAFILNIYDGLRRTHPDDAVKNGALDVQPGDDLVADRLYTRPGLTLMGATALKGNVYLQVDGTGKALNTGMENVNTFIFRGHWTLVVNGVGYDPIFHSPGVSTLGATLDANYSDGTGRFLADTGKPIPTGEFGATFVHVTDFAAFTNTVQAVAKYYTDHQVDVDWMLGSNFLQRWGKGIFKMKNADLVKNAKALVAGQIPDPVSFMQIIEVALKTAAVTRVQKQALEKVIRLAQT